VLVAGKQDHGPGQHDYPAWQKAWSKLLSERPGVNVADAWNWPTEQQWHAANLVVFYLWNHDWSAERLGQMDDYLERGGGLAMLHAATIADKEPERLAARIGLAAQPGPTKYLHTPFVLQFVASANQPITSGLARPLIWTYEKGRGRVFASIPGHYSWTFADPLFRTLVFRGLAWAAGEPVDRLD
jgi:type 1 glutamine amidotransferase